MNFYINNHKTGLLVVFFLLTCFATLGYHDFASVRKGIRYSTRTLSQ